MVRSDPSLSSTSTATPALGIAVNRSTETKLPDREDPTVDQQTERGNFAVFYNIYIPPDPDETQEKIVRSQLKAIRKSSWRNDTIYYNLIGHDAPFVREVCDSCHRLGYYKQGWEDVTLTSVLKYCRRNPNDTIAYMHNKGSLNSNIMNDMTRRMATKSVLSDPCRTMPPPYNVCGFRFHIYPFTHFSTNLFAAKCHYVRRLMPPALYGPVRLRFCRVMMETHHDQNCNTSAVEEPVAINQTLGFGRYAMERWIMSHPLVVPGQVFNDSIHKFHSGWEEWTPVLVPPGGAGVKQPKTEVRSRLKHQLRQFQYLYGEHAPPHGFCRVTLRRVTPPLCNTTGPGFKFESIYHNTVAPMIRDFADDWQ